MPQADSSSTTSSKTRRGRPGGKAERRLKREIINKQALLRLLSELGSSVRSFTDAATANPVIGVVAGIIAVDVLYRARLISTLAYASSLATIGALGIGSVSGELGNEVANIIGQAGNLIPSIGAKATPVPQSDLISPSNNYTFAPGKPDTAKKSVGISKEYL